MKTIKGFEGEDLEVSNFGEWIGNDYIDYKFEYENNRKVMKELQQENQELNERIKVALEVLEERQNIYSDKERLKQLEETNSIECVIEILHGNY